VARLEKHIQRLSDSPRSISDRELIGILKSLGFDERSGEGSHRLFKHPRYGHVLTVPHQDPLKVTYVIQARKIINEVMELMRNDE